MVRRVCTSVCLALLVGACSSSGGSSGKTTASSTTSVPASGAPSTTSASATTFIEAVTTLRGQVRAAGTDLCKLRAVLESIGRTGDPQTREDTKAAVGFVVELYTAVATALDVSKSDAAVHATAEVWRAAAKAVGDVGAKVDYAPSALDSGAELGLPDNFSEASQEFGTLTDSCNRSGT